MHSGSSFQQLLHSARGGAPERVGQLLQVYRNYLQILASTQLDRKLQGRISASDLVQETMLGAYRDFAHFRGVTEPELLAWLRQILINKLRVFVQQHVLAAKRDVRREFSLQQVRPAAGASGGSNGDALLADRGASPGADCIRRETAIQLSGYLARMSAPYRDVIVLRNFRGLPFEEVAAQMQRSVGAVRMLWLRAVTQLRQWMEAENEACSAALNLPAPNSEDCRPGSSSD